MPILRFPPICGRFSQLKIAIFRGFLAGLIALGLGIRCKSKTEPTRPEARELNINFRPESASQVSSTTIVSPSTHWSNTSATNTIVGWKKNEGIQARIRDGVKEPLASFVFSTKSSTLRVRSPKGLVAFEIVAGDMAYADKALQVAIPSNPALHLPSVDRLAVGEFARLRWTMEITEPFIDLVFSASRGKTWAISSMAMRPAESQIKPELTHFRPRPVVGPSAWIQTAKMGNPKIALRNDGECIPIDSANNSANNPARRLKPSEYIDLIANIVDEYRQHQSSDGRILDPYKKREIQYATPAYAFAAATVAKALGRPELTSSARLSLKKSVEQLITRTAPDQHEDFYPVMIAHALQQFGDDPRTEQQKEQLKQQLASSDPWSLYTTPAGSGNWNVAALAGEHLLNKMGIRSEASFWKDSLSLQSSHMNNKFGHYLSEENSTAYDVFPRVWIGDVLSSGFDGRDAEAMAQVWDRAAWVTLLAQSPSGELPSGGRSSSQLWNDAALCALFENAANRAFQSGDKERAGLFRAAAHLALSSLQRWSSSQPAFPIVKNHIKLPNRHGLEPYAHASNYALLSAALLALAHQYFNPAITESCPLAHTGSFVLDMTSTLEKIIANHKGGYLAINTRPHDSNDPVGLVRIDFKHVNPLLLIPGGLRKSTTYHLPPRTPRIDAAVSMQWRKPSEKWSTLSTSYSSRHRAKPWKSATVENVLVSENKVAFSMVYQDTQDSRKIIESYEIFPRTIRIKSRLELGKRDDPHVLRMTAPIWSHDDLNSRTKPRIHSSTSGCIEIETPNDHHPFHRIRWCSNAGPLHLSRERYPYRFGWANLLTSQEISSSQEVWLEMTIVD